MDLYVLFGIFWFIFYLPFFVFVFFTFILFVNVLFSVVLLKINLLSYLPHPQPILSFQLMNYVFNRLVSPPQVNLVVTLCYVHNTSLALDYDILSDRYLLDW